MDKKVTATEADTITTEASVGGKKLVLPPKTNDLSNQGKNTFKKI